MTTATIKCFVYQYEAGGSEPHYVIFSSANQSDKWYTLIGPASFEYTIPEDFNATAAKVAALEAKKAQALAEYQQTVADLNRRLSELQALECVS